VSPVAGSARDDDAVARIVDQHAESSTTTIPVSTYYSLLRQTGQRRGPSFAALKTVERHGGGKASAEIILPPEAPQHILFNAHPVILDAAVQSLWAALSDVSLPLLADATYLPESIESVRVYERLHAKVRCHVNLQQTDEQDCGIRASAWLVNDAGLVVATIDGIYLRRVPDRKLLVPIEHKIFDTRWVPDSLGPAPASSLGAGCWILLTNGDDLSSTASSVVAAITADQGRVVIASLADERSVLAAIEAPVDDVDPPLNGIIAVLEPREPLDPSTTEALTHSQSTVLRLSSVVRAAIQRPQHKSPRLWLVSRGGLAVDDGEFGDPGVGALRGIVRTLAFEHPELGSTLVDLDPGTDCTSELLAELRANPADDIVAFRRGIRYAERLKRAQIGPEAPKDVVSAEGSYVISGGLGGLGLNIARWLVHGGAGRVILNSRSAPTAEVEAKVLELNSAAEVVIELGDVSNTEVAARLVKTAEETGRPLRGLVHAAGVFDDGRFSSLDFETLAGVWRPKAAGALALHHATSERELDWWVAFSSMASMIGSPEYAAHASASAWLDAFVEWRRAQGSPASVINWGQWSDVGFATSVVIPVVDPIVPSEGVDAFGTLLLHNPTRIGVARLRPDRALTLFPELKRMTYFEDITGEFGQTDEMDDWIGPDGLRQLDSAEAIKVVVERLNARLSVIIGTSSSTVLDANAPLLSVGMNSLMVISIKNACRLDFGVEPSVGLLIQGASLRELENDIVNQLDLGPARNADDADQPKSLAVERARERRSALARRSGGDTQ
jgi:phthiocerol/phenolphthiocerol synthesis type-I polyketide synthase D